MMGMSMVMGAVGCLPGMEHVALCACGIPAHGSMRRVFMM